MSGNSRNSKFLSKLLSGKNGKKHKHRHSATMERSSSNQSPNRSSLLINDGLLTLPHRGRSHTVGNGTELSRPSVNNKRSCSSAAVLAHSLSTEISYTPKEMDVQMTLASPRHFLRRGGMAQAQIQDHFGSSKLAKQVSDEDSDQVTVCFEQDTNKMKDSTGTKETQSLRDILEFFLCIKHNLITDDELEACHITATRCGSPVPVHLDDPSTNYAACVVDIKLTKQETESNEKEKVFVFQSIQDCLSFFNEHGLEELPLPVSEDEDSYRLPRVQQMDPIERSWAELPIDPEEKAALTKKELEQQQAIWELIYTEHSHMRNLDVIINIFMRCLELIRRAKLLTEDGYHNVFGYMEYIYNAHERFWTYTLEPCLEKVRENHKPLDLGLIFERFPDEFATHFEIYEQHCALEKINLTNLNRAMSNPDFMAYLKWCEARPECNRLDLKSYLAMPMQRLTKYPLLISAISKKTTDPGVKQRLSQIWNDIHEFVAQVNSGVQAQEETERVKDAMSRITAYNVVDVPSELKDFVNQFTHLDLLAPMPDVEVDKQRVLIVEGSLKYRDHSNTRMVVHIFLFTDILLVTKPLRRAGDKFSVVRPPYKIASLVLRPLEPGSFLLIELNDFGVLTSWFILKAHTSEIAQKWMDHISSAQQIYTEAVERKAINWNYLQTLRSERILNGIDQNEALSTSLSNSLWSINNLSGQRLRNSMSSSNESLMSKRGSTPSIRNHHPPITRTTSVGLNTESSGQQIFSSPRLNGFTTNFGSNPSLYPGTSSIDKLSLERTSSLGKLSERPYREHNTTMKTISETQLGAGMFTDEDLSSDAESSDRPHGTSERTHRHRNGEELCSVDESLTSDDCSTQSSTDTQITNSELIDAAAAVVNNIASSPQRLENYMSSTLSSHKSVTSPNRSPNLSPLHQKLHCSLSNESRVVTVSPTLLSTSNGPSSQLKSILRSPSASITSLSSISPTHSTHSTSFEQRLSGQTPPMPSTPTSSSAEPTHSVLIEGTTIAHSHTILPTGNVDTPKNGKSPSPSPSMDLEVVACKTVVDDRRFCDSNDNQWLNVETQQRGRSQSDTSDNLRRGLEFHVTFVNETNARTMKSNASVNETDAGLELNDNISPTLLHTKDKNPLPIIRQASDSLIMSQRQANSRPHKVMFSECTQVLSFDSESIDSDIEEKIKIVRDDVSTFALNDVHCFETTSDRSRLPDSTSCQLPTTAVEDKTSFHQFSEISDEIEPQEPSTAKSQQMAFLPTAIATALSIPATNTKTLNEKELREHMKKTVSYDKNVTVPPAHKRVTGKHVRELSQMFERVCSPDPTPSSGSGCSSPVPKAARQHSTTRIPVHSELVTDVLKSTKMQSNDSKLVGSQNNEKSSARVGTNPPKVTSKQTKPLNAAKRRTSTVDKVVLGSNQSPASTRKTIPARKNSVCQQKSGIASKTTTNGANRRVSRTAEHAPIATISRNTSSPVVGSRRQALSTKAPASPNPKLRSSKSQTATIARDSVSSNNKLTKLSGSNPPPPRSRLQRQPSVVSSRSPSPYSSGQASHKPLSRLSGTRQPLRRKSGGSGSNNVSPAVARRNSRVAKPTVIELNCNNSNNNNIDGTCSGCVDERCDKTAADYFTVTADPWVLQSSGSSHIPSQMSDTSQSLFPNSSEEDRLSSDGAVTTHSSLHDYSFNQRDSNSEASGDKVAMCTADGMSSKTIQDILQTDDHKLKLKNDIRYHHSLQSSSLKHMNKRSPLEWQNFGLSWKQSPSSLSYFHNKGGHRVAASKRL